MHRVTGNPSAEPSMAYAIPVLPLVASSRIFPGRSKPRRWASATMLAAARSFTDPPGLYHSALPKSVTPGKSRVTASRRKRGVFPIRSIRLWPSVSPSLEPFWSDSECCSPAANAVVLLEPYVICDLIAVTYVMCQVAGNTVCSILLDESGLSGDAAPVKLRSVLIIPHPIDG